MKEEKVKHKDGKKKKRSSRSSTQTIKLSYYVQINLIITSINYEYILNILAILLFSEIAFNDQIYEAFNSSVDIWIIF